MRRDEGDLLKSARRHKVRFTLTLCSGSVLSCFWFLLHFVVTQEHEVDSDVINYAGRLRLYTQHYGLVFLANSLAVSTSRDHRSSILADDRPGAIGQIDVICAGLLQHSGDKSIPEIRDEEVKDSLRKWIDTHLEPLRSSLQGVPRKMTAPELSDVMWKVSDATQAVDDIVDQASARAKMRVDIILGISIARVVLGVIWALFTGYFFGQLWLPYIRTYNRLQDAEIELKSLLRAAFDIVIPVRATRPFEILGCEEELRHFLGCASVAGTVLSCAFGPDEENELEKFLTCAMGQMEVDVEEPRPRGTCLQRLRSCWAEFSKDECCCWWRFLPGRKDSMELPVAPMIRSRWRSGASEGAQQGLSVEVLMVTKGGARQKDALLAVRAVGDDTIAELPSFSAANFAIPPIRPLGLPLRDFEQASFTSISIMDGGGGTAATHSTSDTGDTAVGAHLGGTLSPASELENTPPPTIIGAGHSFGVQGRPPMPRGGLSQTRTHQEVVGLAQQLEERLRQAEAELSPPSPNILSM